MKAAYIIILLAIIMSGCISDRSDSTTSSINISDEQLNSLHNESAKLIVASEQENGRVVIEKEISYQFSDVMIREWHIDERNVTCWSFAQETRSGIAIYSGFSCIPDDQLEAR